MLFLLTRNTYSATPKKVADFLPVDDARATQQNLTSY